MWYVFTTHHNSPLSHVESLKDLHMFFDPELIFSLNVSSFENKFKPLLSFIKRWIKLFRSPLTAILEYAFVVRNPQHFVLINATINWPSGCLFYLKKLPPLLHLAILSIPLKLKSFYGAGRWRFSFSRNRLSPLSSIMAFNWNTFNIFAL